VIIYNSISSSDCLTNSLTICLISFADKNSEFLIALDNNMVFDISAVLIQTLPFIPTAVSKAKCSPNAVKIGVFGFNKLLQ